jgi:hypothetical protein
MTCSRWHAGNPARSLLLVAGLIVAVASACSGAKQNAAATAAGGTASTSLRQSSDAANVTIDVTWKGRAAGPVFTVAMNTHSVDLDGYDLSKLAVLRTNQGTEAQPASWDAAKGGHHREGTLTFPVTAADGKPLLGPATHSLELTIRGVAGVPERTFRWTL